MWEAIEFEKKDNGVAVITLNRPQALNSFNAELCFETIKACKMVAEDDDIKCLVITGAGKGFTSGGDIGVLAAMDTPAKAKATYDVSTSVVQAVYDLEKPVIAAVNGPVAGAGTALMLACDLIVASENARLAFSFINIAFCPDSGCSYFLTRKVGYNKAAEIIFFGKTLNAEEGLQLGLVNTVVPAEEVLNEALNWAEKLAAGPGLALKMDKKLLRQAYSNDFYQQAELESMYQVLAWASDDFKEGTMAFVEKRKPNFKGK
ncbi:MAG: enoyl-CoA hydratase/isomerase family protein [Candidatus Saccharibacteria bacterium]